MHFRAELRTCAYTHTHSRRRKRLVIVTFYKGKQNYEEVSERESVFPRLRIPRTVVFFPHQHRYSRSTWRRCRPCRRGIFAVRARARLVSSIYIRNRSNGHVFSSSSNRCTRDRKYTRAYFSLSGTCTRWQPASSGAGRIKRRRQTDRQTEKRSYE